MSRAHVVGREERWFPPPKDYGSAGSNVSAEKFVRDRVAGGKRCRGRALLVSDGQGSPPYS